MQSGDQRQQGAASRSPLARGRRGGIQGLGGHGILEYERRRPAGAAFMRAVRARRLRSFEGRGWCAWPHWRAGGRHRRTRAVCLERRLGQPAQQHRRHRQHRRHVQHLMGTQAEGAFLPCPAALVRRAVSMMAKMGIVLRRQHAQRRQRPAACRAEAQGQPALPQGVGVRHISHRYPGPRHQQQQQQQPPEIGG
ncbi:hypothetical protein G6F22_017212 [Rhizopus arrhizus]|nr:hypothetical protein G6F22_017212 [Rhizopus arrhizus]